MNEKLNGTSQTPTQVNCGIAHQGGRAFVVLQIGTAQAVLEPDAAIQLGSNIMAAAGIGKLSVEELRRMASAMDSGLLLPTSPVG